MKLHLIALLMLAAAVETVPAAVTGRTEKTTPGGGEKILMDDSGVDKYMTVSNLFTGGLTITGPVLSGATASGSGALDFSGSSGAFKTSTGLNTFGGSGHAFAAKLYPVSNDGAALGDSTHQFSDLFLASGAVVNLANGDVVITHSSGVWTMGTGELRVTTPGTNSASVPTLGSTSTLTNKTLTAPVLGGTVTGTYTLGGAPTLSAGVISGGLTASGSASNDFSSSTGTFKTSTGANTLGGAVTINDAATPSLTTASGKTNTGFVLINGKTSGGLKLTSADAAAYAVTVSLAAQTTGTATLYINDLANTNGAVMTSTLSTNTPHVAAGVWGASNGLVMEGATADGYETTLSPVDPTADQTVSIPNFAVNWAVVGSTLTTNKIDAANSLWMVSNGLVMEGATADGYETTLSPVDPTADQTVSVPNFGVNWAVLGSTLTTNTVDAANSIWGVSNALTFEGATADAYEGTLTIADVTADITYKLPDAAAGTYAAMLSTLATNAPDVANSVTGASNGLVMEGATADSYETTIAPTDPTADRTVTLPDASGTVSLAQGSTTTALTSDNQAVTPGGNTRLQLTSDNATATNRTFTLSATGAITGQIYVICGPATNACEMADTGIQKLSATWTPDADDTLTLWFDGTNFRELARSAN